MFCLGMASVHELSPKVALDRLHAAPAHVGDRVRPETLVRERQPGVHDVGVVGKAETQGDTAAKQVCDAFELFAPSRDRSPRAVVLQGGRADLEKRGLVLGL